MELNQSKLLLKFSKERNVEVQRCGLFISKTHPFLAASPDGVVGDAHLVEI